MSRRLPSNRAAWIAFAILWFFGCRGPTTPAQPAPSEAPAATVAPEAGDHDRGKEGGEEASNAGRPVAPEPEGTEDLAPLDFVEFVTAGADTEATLPMVVLVHGLGDRPERFSTALRDFDVPVRVVAPRAPTPWHDGGSWFPVRARDPDVEALARGVATAADRLAAAIRWFESVHPTQGKPIVTGFSQGGILSFAVAVRHPDVVAAAVPVGGLLPDPLLPDKLPSDPPPIVALHGTEDRTVAYDRARRTVEHLARMGWPARLESFPGVGHTIPKPMHRAWLTT
ncbi:MAG: hypothetical protein D6705_17535, partial [Deltaproteobacteria bacterium]